MNILLPTQDWIQTSDFQTVGATAISAKRQGDYTQAIAIFNELAQGCPHYHQVHRSAMKVLAASDQINAALRAAQLWCVAIIPEKALHLSAVHPKPTTINGPDHNQRLHYLAGWAIAEQKSMYHLGSLHMIAHQDLSPQEKEAYILTLQGQQKKALHPPKAAIQKRQAHCPNIAMEKPHSSYGNPDLATPQISIMATGTTTNPQS